MALVTFLSTCPWGSPRVPTLHGFYWALAAVVVAVSAAPSPRLSAQTSSGPVLALAAAAPAPLAAAYRLRLRSAWPALSAAPPGCTDPGSEALEGSLVRVGDASYEGRFVRSTTLRFCGPHGVAARRHCGGTQFAARVVGRVAADLRQHAGHGQG